MREIVTWSEEAYRAASAGLHAMIIDQDWPRAGEHVKQAVATDPTFAAAYFYLYAVSLLGNDAEAVTAGGTAVYGRSCLPLAEVTLVNLAVSTQT